MGRIDWLDFSLFHAVNHLAGHYDSIDDLVEFISSKGPIALVLMILAAWFWPGSRVERDQRQWGGIAATIAASLALAINQGIIRVWDRPRPFEAHQVVLLLKPSADPSFPSDHATFSFAVAVALFLAWRRLGIAALVVAVLISLSRVYVGEHYLGDVVAGAVIGSVMAVAVFQLRTVAMPLIDPPMRLARRVRLA
jgi:undecaprenyl-diphosphatase